MHNEIMQNAYMADQGMADRLKRARELDGRFKDASEAARSLRIAPPTYLAHENGSRGFRASAAKYARFYKVRLEWLLEGMGTPRGKSLGLEFIDMPPDMLAELLRYAEYLRSRKPE